MQELSNRSTMDVTEKVFDPHIRPRLPFKSLAVLLVEEVKVISFNTEPDGFTGNGMMHTGKAYGESVIATCYASMQQGIRAERFAHLNGHRQRAICVGDDMFGAQADGNFAKGFQMCGHNRLADGKAFAFHLSIEDVHRRAADTS